MQQEKATRLAREAVAYMKKSDSRTATNYQNDSNQRSNTYEYKPTYKCSFCCEGQWGSCRTNKTKVDTQMTDQISAIKFVQEQYKSQCASFPFYSGGGGSASVSYPDCNTY